jgi:hypothetical protein
VQSTADPKLRATRSSRWRGSSSFTMTPARKNALRTVLAENGGDVEALRLLDEMYERYRQLRRPRRRPRGAHSARSARRVARAHARTPRHV